MKNNIKTLWRASMNPVINGSLFLLGPALVAFVILLPYVMFKRERL